MKGIILDKFQKNKNIKSLTFKTFKDVSDYIRNELKSLNKFNFTCFTEKKFLESITYFKLKEDDIIYVIRNKRYIFRKNILELGEI